MTDSGITNSADNALRRSTLRVTLFTSSRTRVYEDSVKRLRELQARFSLDVQEVDINDDPEAVVMLDLSCVPTFAVYVDDHVKKKVAGLVSLQRLSDIVEAVTNSSASGRTTLKSASSYPPLVRNQATPHSGLSRASHVSQSPSETQRDSVLFQENADVPSQVPKPSGFQELSPDFDDCFT